MPNWITNRVTLRGTEQKKIDEVFDFLRGEETEFDFDNIIPMPEELKAVVVDKETDKAWAYYLACELGDYSKIDECLIFFKMARTGIETREEVLSYFLEGTPDIYEKGQELYRLKKTYGYRDWYEWAVENWNVKYNSWNAKREGNIISFITVIEGVSKLISKVSEKFPEVVIDYEYADENFGCNTARYTFVNGDTTLVCEPEDDTEEALQLAEDIFGCNIDEFYKD